MQFLAYLTVLIVAISTVLLEVHWLASPEPQPKPAVQTSAPAQAWKTASGVKTVYPKSPDSSRPVESDSQAQTTDTRQATGQTTPATNPPGQHPAQTPPAQQPESPASVPQSATSEQPALATQPVPPQQPSPAPSTQPAAAPQPEAQQSRAETTGAAVREQNRTQVAPPNSSSRADNSQQEATPGSSRNRCDVLACAGTYRSFRANDCTYQPFDGAPRRLCEKSPGQQMAREREQPERRRWSRDAETRYSDRPTSGRRLVDEYDDVAADFDAARREPLGFFLFGRRPGW
jgi:hypothetical protein